MTNRHLTRTAVFVVLERDDKVFCIRRHNTGWADGMLTIPSGHVDEGHRVLEAAAIEVQEEAGITLTENDLEFIHVDYVRDSYVNFYFRASTWEGEPKVGEPDRANEAVWVDPTDLPDDVIPQVRNLFAKLAVGEVFSEMER